MAYTYPLPTPPVVDTSALTAAIAAMQADDVTDDKALADLKKAVEAIVVPDVSGLAAKSDIPKLPDLTPYALKSEIPNATASKGEITPVYDPLPAPSPIVTPVTLAGATLVTGVTGSVMVNNGAVHSFARTSTPPILTWNGTLSISPVTGPCKVRWAITSTILGTTEVSIDGAAALQANNTGNGWSSGTPSIAVFTDGGFTWFEVAVPAKGTGATTIQVTIPVGRGQLPTVYAANAISSLTSSTPTALKLKDPTTSFELVYRPTELAKKTDIPAATDLMPLTNRVVALESETHGLWLSKQSIIDWTSDEVETGRVWSNGDLTYQRMFTGTTPNNANDSLVFSIPGAKEIVWWHGQATQATGRKPAMEGLYSGNAAHGSMYTWYTVKTNNVVTALELRQFNQTGDTRYQNIPYFVIVEYTK